MNVNSLIQFWSRSQTLLQATSMWLPLGDWFSLSECSKCKHTVGCPFCPWFSTGELTPQGCCQWKKQEDVRSGQAAIGDCIQIWCQMWYLIHKLLVVLKALLASTASLQMQWERLWTIISLELLSKCLCGRDFCQVCGKLFVSYNLSWSPHFVKLVELYDNFTLT